jgi:hypothetical protein
LATTDDARVHCAVLKIRAVPARAPPRYAGGAFRSEGRPGARSLRTQQRARPVRRRPPPFHSRTGCTSWVEQRSGRITSAPHVSSHPGTPARDVALDAADRRSAGRTAPGAP